MICVSKMVGYSWLDTYSIEDGRVQLARYIQYRRWTERRIDRRILIWEYDGQIIEYIEN